MFSASVFGVSFPDVIGQELGMHYDRKVALWQMKRQKEMAEWQAKNMPKFQREGLEAAGINPLLAYHSGIGSQSLPSAYAMPQHSGQLGGFDASAFQASKKLFTDILDDEDRQREAEWMKSNKERELLSAQIKKLEAECEGINSENKILQAEARNADSIANAKGVASELQSQRDYAEFSALGGQLPTIIVGENSPHPFENERFRNYVNKILNEIESSAYSASKKRAIIKDVIESSSSLIDIVNGVKGMKGKPKQPPKPLLKRKVKWKSPKGDNVEDYEYL